MEQQEHEWSTTHPDYLSPEEEPEYPPNSRLGRPQSQSGCFCSRENLLPLPHGFQSQILKSETLGDISFNILSFALKGCQHFIQHPTSRTSPVS
jgi:hypothetical protein